MYAEQYTVYPYTGILVLHSSFISSYKVVQGGQSSRFAQEYVHQRRVG